MKSNVPKVSLTPSASLDGTADEKKEFLDRENHNTEIISADEISRKKSLNDINSEIGVGGPVEWIPPEEAIVINLNNSSKSSKKKVGWRQYIGIGCAIGSSISFSIVMCKQYGFFYFTIERIVFRLILHAFANLINNCNFLCP